MFLFQQTLIVGLTKNLICKDEIMHCFKIKFGFMVNYKVLFICIYCAINVPQFCFLQRICHICPAEDSSPKALIPPDCGENSAHFASF